MRALAVIGVLLLALAAASAQQSSKPAAPRFETPILQQVFNIIRDEQSDYPLSDIHQGCPRTDCIQSIDQPRYIPASKAQFLSDDDLVMGFVAGGIARAYPSRIMARHEIVNDQLGDLNYVITFCPLCGSGLAFDRKQGDTILSFGVSGLLHGSDLIMYDRQSRSLWQQITAKAFAGPRRGETLRVLPLRMIEWRRWREQHPDTQVLLPEIDSGIDYIDDVYANYRSDERIRFGGKNDPRLHPKRVVHGIAGDRGSLAVDASWLQQQGRVSARLGDLEITISMDADGLVTAEDKQSGASLPVVRLFWFAWYTFHPDTVLLTAQD